jgi:hypothetical protein
MKRMFEVLARLRTGWIREGLMLATLVAGLALFAHVADGHYPLRHWLFFVYARLWLLGSLFMLSSLAAGWRLLSWILPEPSPIGERLVIAHALGVLTFVWGLFLFGILGWLGLAVFWGWPLALLLFGGPRLVRDARRYWKRLRPFGFRLFQPRGIFEGLALAGLVLCLVATYLLVMTPANVAYDARWYHMRITENYASGGRIIPFQEGWYLGAIPQLSSLLYMWGFIGPGTFFERLSLASHLEWFLFIPTLLGVSVLARRLLGGSRVPYAAAVVFLFPGILTYDSALASMADHIAAFWAAPLALALLRMRRSFGVREAVVAALVTSGAALTKYQCSYMVVGAILAVTGWAIWRRRARPFLAFAATGIVATSLHWLKNLVFYGDPLYPFLYKWLPSRPLLPGKEQFVNQDQLAAQFALHGPPLYKLEETAKALFTFSFIPHDWPAFHGDRPVFGSLFTLLLPVLLLVRAKSALWLIVAGTHLGLAIWFVTSHEDRYIQNLLPWMAAATTAFLVLAWRHGKIPVRAALLTLVLFQIVWGADLYFLRNHAMAGDSLLKVATDRIAAGHEKRYKDRLTFPGGMDVVTPALPKDAKVLIHNIRLSLGIGRPVVDDENSWQLGIDYLAYATPEKTFATWRKLGITHAVWVHQQAGGSYEQVAREATFAHALEVYGGKVTSIGGYQVMPLSRKSAKGARTPTRVAWLGCGGDPPLGVYTPAQIVTRQAERLIAPADLASDAKGQLADVPVAVLRSACGSMSPASAELRASFKQMFTVGDISVWTRKQ